MDESKLKPDTYYWVKIDLDYFKSGRHTSGVMPALFVGTMNGQSYWKFIGNEGLMDWPVVWVGSEIEPPITCGPGGD